MKRKRAPWPRWAKIARNLLLFLVMALILWGQLGKPLPYGMALRREARQYLLPEMDHHIEISRGYWGDDMRLDWTEGAAMASVPAQEYLTFAVRPVGTPYRLTDGPNLLPFPWTVLLPEEGEILMSSYAVYAAIFPPESAATAILTLHNNSGTYTVAGQREGEVFLFYAHPDPEEDGSRSMDSSWFFPREFTYKLSFYDLTGKAVDHVFG